MIGLTIGRRSLIAGGIAALLPFRALAKGNWRGLAMEVRGEMRWAWDQYREKSWGKDQIMPVSGESESFSIKVHHLGPRLGWSTAAA